MPVLIQLIFASVCPPYLPCTYHCSNIICSPEFSNLRWYSLTLLWDDQLLAIARQNPSLTGYKESGVLSCKRVVSSSSWDVAHEYASSYLKDSWTWVFCENKASDSWPSIFNLVVKAAWESHVSPVETNPKGWNHYLKRKKQCTLSWKVALKHLKAWVSQSNGVLVK